MSSTELKYSKSQYSSSIEQVIASLDYIYNNHERISNFESDLHSDQVTLARINSKYKGIKYIYKSLLVSVAAAFFLFGFKALTGTNLIFLSPIIGFFSIFYIKVNYENKKCPVLRLAVESKIKDREEELNSLYSSISNAYEINTGMMKQIIDIETNGIDEGVSANILPKIYNTSVLGILYKMIDTDAFNGVYCALTEIQKVFESQTDLPEHDALQQQFREGENKSQIITATAKHCIAKNEILLQKANAAKADTK